jgi:hypothetical protein
MRVPAMMGGFSGILHLRLTYFISPRLRGEVGGQRQLRTG